MAPGSTLSRRNTSFEPWMAMVLIGLILGSCGQAAAECHLQDCGGPTVCGKDGLTYQNRCFAECADVDIVDYTGPCKGLTPAHTNLATLVGRLAKFNVPTINLASTSNSDVGGRNWLYQDPLTESDVFRYAHLGLRLVGRQPPVQDYSYEELQTLPNHQATPVKGASTGDAKPSQSDGTGSSGDSGGYMLVQRLTKQGGVYAAVIPHDQLRSSSEEKSNQNVVKREGRKLKNIIGSDDEISTVRPYDPPFRYAGQVSFKGNSGDVRWCSGSMISPYTVLTAGHCVFHLWEQSDPESYLYPIMYYYPGRRYLYAQNKTSNPYGIYTIGQKTVLSYYSNSGYVAASEGSMSWDVGMLELEVPIQFGFFSLGVYDVNMCQNLTVVGYPGHKHKIYPGSQWHTSCPACPDNRVEGTTLLAVDCDWTPGISGAPLFIKDGRRWKVVAVAVGEYMSGAEYYPRNIATTITTSIYSGLSRFMYSS